MSGSKHANPGLSTFVPTKTEMFPFSRKEYESNINRLFDDVYAKSSISTWKAVGASLLSFGFSGFLSLFTAQFVPLFGLAADTVQNFFVCLYVTTFVSGGALFLFSRANGIKNFPKGKYFIIDSHMKYAFDDKQRPSSPAAS